METVPRAKALQDAMTLALSCPDDPKVLRDLLEAVNPDIKVFRLVIGNIEGRSEWRRKEPWHKYVKKLDARPLKNKHGQ